MTAIRPHGVIINSYCDRVKLFHFKTPFGYAGICYNSRMDNDLKRMIDGESGTFVIGPMKPKELLQQVADSDGPGALFARLCLECPDFEIGQRITLDSNDNVSTV